MISLVRGEAGLTLNVLALALGIGVFSDRSAVADDNELASMSQTAGHGHDGSGYGILGYGGFGLYRGFHGFGLSYHLGYGYGGQALGVGVAGGYPFYGGPGYLHDAPVLNRFGPIAPFAYCDGPGYPYSFTHPGQLAVDRPLAFSGDAYGQGYPFDVGFGPFTGAIPYPESLFAPYTAAAARSGSSTNRPTGRSPAFTSPDTAETAGLPAQGPYLGIDEEPVTDGDGVRGMKVAKVYPGTSAETAGLHVGDVIYSINGYLTIERGNLAWIIANRAYSKVLSMNVRTLSDGKAHTITAHLPGAAANTTRPSFLPPVGDGPPPATR
jgi:PDZ domain